MSTVRRRAALLASLLAALVASFGGSDAVAAPKAASATSKTAPAAEVRAVSVLERSVVRLTNTSQRADWRTPWSSGRPGTGTGSGFVVEGGRILTNAHVVADSKNLVIHLHGDANPHPARIVAIGHDCDLALVEPVEPGLLNGLKPLILGEQPAIGDEVKTFGYPVGGRWLSSTRGVVSRIDVISSVHSPGSDHLAIQTDAAINPGNSGGPVLHDGRVVGVAFQGAGALENVGYFIPPLIVQHFLDDVAEGDGYEGFPALDVKLVTLDAPAARRRAGMAPDETGVWVDFVHPGSPAKGVLQRGDVLLSLDGEALSNDGTFAHADQRLQLQAILDRFHVGDSISARVLRGGERLSLSVPLARTVYPQRPYETLPPYLIFAGLVFVPLDREYWATTGGKDSAILYEYYYRQLGEPEAVVPGRVMLLRRLEHEVNASLPYGGGVLLDTINGKPIHTLDDIWPALAANTDQHHVFAFLHADSVAVLDRKKAEAAHLPILMQYAVPEERRR